MREGTAQQQYTERIAARLPPGTRKALQEIADNKRRKLSDLVRLYILDGLARDKAEAQQ